MYRGGKQRPFYLMGGPLFDYVMRDNGRADLIQLNVRRLDDVAPAINLRTNIVTVFLR